MWIVTPIGFFSIVQKPGDKAAGLLTVRARVRSDLDALRASALPTLGETIESRETDYRFRAVAPRQDVQAAISKLVAELDYSNFKSKVAKAQGPKRERLYHDVWSVLHRMQGDPAYEATSGKAAQPAIPAIPKADAYGGVLIDSKGMLLLREVANHFGGYVWTFAKGKPDAGETPSQTALREVLEETGYQAEIVGALPQAFPGSTSSTAFYLMTPVGEQGTFMDETWQTRWVTFVEARKLIGLTKIPSGRTRDLAVLDAAAAALESHVFKLR